MEPNLWSAAVTLHNLTLLGTLVSSHCITILILKYCHLLFVTLQLLVLLFQSTSSHVLAARVPILKQKCIYRPSKDHLTAIILPIIIISFFFQRSCRPNETFIKNAYPLNYCFYPQDLRKLMKILSWQGLFSGISIQ